jgi:hypothetical protein
VETGSNGSYDVMRHAKVNSAMRLLQHVKKEKREKKNQHELIKASVLANTI